MADFDQALFDQQMAKQRQARELGRESIPIMFWLPMNRGQDDYPKRNPKGFIRDDIPQAKRDAVVDILTHPEHDAAQRGFALCRMCKDVLGTHDFMGHGFVWPERAEHYILEHGVWIPELDDLLVAANRT